METYKKTPSGAVINTDEQERQTYIRLRGLAIQQKQEKVAIEDKVAQLETKLTSIESLLTELIKRLPNG